MYREELRKLEGVWVGSERVDDGGTLFEASSRLVFQLVFDGKFLTCDYVQTGIDKKVSVGHGVFRSDDRTSKLTVTWFRSPVATTVQQTEGVADGDKLIFLEVIGNRTTRTTYAAQMDKLSVRTESLVGSGEWRTVLEGTYRRR